ncbi:MAG: hypothetical protein RIT81_46235 [Deltaproteobacteria bacterium]
MPPDFTQTTRLEFSVERDRTLVCRHLDSSKSAARITKDFSEAVLALVLKYPKAGRLRFELSGGDGLEEGVLFPMLGLALGGLRVPIDVEVRVDGEVVSVEPPDYASVGKLEDWLRAIRTRPVLPPELEALARDVPGGALAWHRTVTGTEWSGRVFGCQIMTIADSGRGRMTVGRPGSQRRPGPRQRFLEAVVGQNGIELDVDSLSEQRPTIERFAETHPRDDEHALEASVLGGETSVIVRGRPLTRLIGGVPFQFPTMWNAHEAECRYLDILMRDGERPWAVELKWGSLAEYTRNGVVQAALYREFIRRAKTLHPIFRDHGVDPEACEAILAYPRTTKQSAKRSYIAELARLFGVEIVELDVRFPTQKKNRT